MSVVSIGTITRKPTGVGKLFAEIANITKKWGFPWKIPWFFYQLAKKNSIIIKDTTKGKI